MVTLAGLGIYEFGALVAVPLVADIVHKIHDVRRRNDGSGGLVQNGQSIAAEESKVQYNQN